MKQSISSKIRHMDSYIIIFVALLLAFVGIKQLMAKKSASQIEAGTSSDIESIIRHVKGELRKSDSIRMANKEAELFHVKTFDLEINFIVRKTNSMDAKVQYEVVTLGSNQEFSNEHVQKISLHFEAAPTDQKREFKP